MESIIIAGLSAGTLATLLVSSEIAAPLRRWIKKPLHCAYCTSFWTALAFDPSRTVLATMAVANITILFINWSLSTAAPGDEHEDEIAPDETSEGYDSEEDAWE